MRKKLLFLLSVLCVLFVNINCASAYIEETNTDTGYSYVIDDQAGYFSELETKSLEELVESITEYSNVAVLTTTSHNFYSTESLAESAIDTYFGYDDSLIFVIDRCLNEIYLYSTKGTYKLITSSRAYSITDNTYIYATSSRNYDYYTCTYKTLEQCLAILTGKRIAQPMKYICSALLALICGLFLTYFIVMLTSSSKKAKDAEILQGTFTKLYVHNPKKVFLSQSKRYSPQSSGSSGGGGGGGGGGGRSGGGGGHSI